MYLLCIYAYIYLIFPFNLCLLWNKIIKAFLDCLTNCQLTLHYHNLDYLTHLQYAIVTGASDFSDLSKVLGSVNELWLWIQPNILLMSAWSVFCLSLLISVCGSLEVKWSDVTVVIALTLAAHSCAVWIHCKLSFW